MALANEMVAGRAAERELAARKSTLRAADRRPLDVYIEDLSTVGARVRSSADLHEGEQVSLGLPGVGVRDALVVRRTGPVIGCEFATPLSLAELAAALTAQTVVSVQPEPPVAANGAGRFLVEADTPKLPLRLRVGIILGSSLALWTGIGAALYVLIA